MAGRRISYVLLLAGTLCFAIAYQKWLAWFLLAAVVALPLFSLLVSLPAMLMARIRMVFPDAVTLGQPLEPAIQYQCPLPIPVWRCVLMAERTLTGHRWRLREEDPLPTDHCGILNITTAKAKIYDYAGLFRRRAGISPRTCQVAVRPVPVAVAQLPSLDVCLYPNWKPKAGGGFAENHELRLYRPGDSIQQIHWKLSAKTGALILRQPMEPVRGRVLLRMDLKGSAALLDSKLGQLLWLGQRLLEKDIHFHIQCLTGNGMEQWHISGENTLIGAIDAIMSRPQAVSGSLADSREQAVWQYYIGGDSHEGQ